MPDESRESIRGALDKDYGALEAAWIKRRSQQSAAPVEKFLIRQRQILGAEDRDVYGTEILLAKIWRDGGRYGDALALAHHATDGLAAQLGDAVRETQRARLTTASILYELARWREALVEFQRVASQPLSEDTRATRLIAQLELVLTHTKLGELGAAAKVGEAALIENQHRLNEKDEALAALMDNLAGVYLDVGRFDDAVAMQERAQTMYEAVYGRDHPISAAARSNLGAVYFGAGRFDDAISQARTSVRDQAGNQDSPTRNWLLSRIKLASFLRQSGAIDEAEQELVAVQGLINKHFGLMDPDAIDVRYALARISLARNRLHQARQQMAAACRDYATVGDTFEGTPRLCPMELAMLEWNAGQREEALQRMGAALSAFEARTASQGLTDHNQQSLFAERVPYFRRWAEWLIASRRTADAFAVTERLRGRVLLQSVVLQNADNSAALPAEDSARLAEIKADVARLDELTAREKDGTRKAGLKAERDTRFRDLAALRNELRDTYPRYAALSRFETVDAARARQVVPTGAVALAYVVGAERLHVFVVRRDAPLVTIDLGPVGPLRAEVDAALALFSGASDVIVWRDRNGRLESGSKAPGQGAQRVTDWRVAARALGTRLLRPVAAHLTGRSQVIIVPDGPLAQLPFEALMTDERPLAASANVRYVQSMSVLAAMQERLSRAPGGRSVLSVGAPDYTTSPDRAVLAHAAHATTPPQRIDALALARGTADDPSMVRRAYEHIGTSWAALPSAALEVAGVQRVFAGDSRKMSLTGADASEQRLQHMNRSRDLREFRYLHFATHGYLNPEVPALSAIVLAQNAVSDTADGYLTAAELPGYTLDSDLIVLSACETGRGKQLSGEGVMGLPYALFVAGNRATITTLWKVVDASTARFVTRLFEHIAEGRNAPDALAEVRREFISDRRTAHPLHWAPFVYYGK